MATIIRLNRRGSSLSNLEQRGLDLDCAELSSRPMGPDEESSSATTVGSFQGSVTLCRVEEEGRIASRRQAAIDARMASVRGALVLRIEESSVLIPESVLTAAQLFASILNTVGSACYWAGLCTPGSALFNVGCSIACVVTAADLARVSHDHFESQFTMDPFHAEGSLASMRKQKLVRQDQENTMLALRMFIVAPLCYDVGVIAYYDELEAPENLLLVASLLFVLGSYALIIGCLCSSLTPHWNPQP